MKLLHILSKRSVLLGIFIYFDILWLTLIILNIIQVPLWLSLFLRLFRLLVMLYIVYREDDAGYKIIWLVFIGMSPFFGTLFYLLIGKKAPSRKLYRSFKKHAHIYDNQHQDEMVFNTVNDLSLQGQMRYFMAQGFSIYHNSDIKYYSVGELWYEDLIQTLNNAKHFIFMEYFIVERGYLFDHVLDILTQKVKEGVEVRFLYDDVGSLMTLPDDFEKEIKKLGIDIVSFNPLLLSFVTNHRDHRKMTIVDGEVGFCGGLNLADEYINRKVRFGHWKDTAIKISGEAVNSMTLLFLDIFDVSKKAQTDHHKYFTQATNDTNGYVIPYGDTPLDEETVGENVYLNMIFQAKKYIYIFTPYLIIDDQMKKSLILAAKRGVDVRICVPGIPDKKMIFRMTRSYYRVLKEYGVRIYEYTPGFLHGKSMICDDQYAVVGTTNLDYRSLFLHFECGVWFAQNDAVLDVKQDFFDTIEKSKEIKDIKQGTFSRIFDFLFRIFAPLL